LNEFADEISSQPYGSIRREMITPAIPYLFRWKILQAKALLKDLIELNEKYHIASAYYAINAVKKEIETLCGKIASDILDKQAQIQQIGGTD